MGASRREDQLFSDEDVIDEVEVLQESLGIQCPHCDGREPLVPGVVVIMVMAPGTVRTYEPPLVCENCRYQFDSRRELLRSLREYVEWSDRQERVTQAEQRVTDLEDQVEAIKPTKR